MGNKSWKPGQKASRSGQYQIIGSRGGKGPERTVVKGGTISTVIERKSAICSG